MLSGKPKMVAITWALNLTDPWQGLHSLCIYGKAASDWQPSKHQQERSLKIFRGSKHKIWSCPLLNINWPHPQVSYHGTRSQTKVPYCITRVVAMTVSPKLPYITITPLLLPGQTAASTDWWLTMGQQLAAYCPANQKINTLSTKLKSYIC